jgi:uncharacterized membrane protein
MVVALTGLVLFAVGVRVLVLNARGIWFDEAFSIYITRIPWREALQQLRLFDLHPPLYHILLRGWIGLGATLAVARGFSVLTGVLTALAAVGLGAQLGGSRTGLLAGFLVAGSAFAIQASVEARMYPLLSLVIVLATWMLVRAVRSPGRWQPWVGYALTMAVAGYVHYFAWLVLLAHGAYVLLYQRQHQASRLGFTAAAAAALLLFAPWLAVAAEQLGTGRFAITWTGAMPVNAPLNILALSSFGGYLLGLGGYLFPSARDSAWQLLPVLPFLGVAALGTLPREEEREGEGVLLLLTWAMPVGLLIAVSVATHTWYAIPRYTVFLQPIFALLLARGLGRLVSRHWSAAAVGAALIVVLNLGVLQMSMADPRFQVFDWAGAARHVGQQWKPGDVLVFYPAGGRVAFGYHFRQPIQDALILFAPWEPHRTKADWARTLPDVPALARNAPRLWLILSIPVSPGSGEALRERIAERYTRVEVRDFQYVWVVLYQKRALSGSSRP